MKTQTQHTHYAEALAIVTGLGQSVDQCFDTVRLGRSGERWSVLFAGQSGPGLNSLIRLFQAGVVPYAGASDSEWTVTVWVGRMGRVEVTIHELTHTIRRVNGRTGEDIPPAGLW